MPSKNNLPPSLIELDPAVTRPAALPDRIYAILKHRILTCAMLPSARVVEKDLCSEMHVSRTPLREALNRLGLEGLVTIAPFRGYAIAPLTIEGFRELCEVRRILESEAAALCAQRATDQDVTRLESLAELRYQRHDRTTYETYLRANSLFHHVLVQATRNTRLAAMVMAALDQHQRPLYMGLGPGVDGKASTSEHEEIVEAIRVRRPARARKAMTLHIARGEERISKALKAAGY